MSGKFLKNLFNTRKKRILLAIFIFLFVLIVSGIVILHSRAFKSYLIQRVDRYLQSRYDLSLSIESLHYSLPRLAATLEGVQVKALPEAELPLELFSAHRVEVNLSFATIFSRKVHIQQLEILRPQIVIKPAVEKSARSLPVEPEKNASEKRPVLLRIDDFSLDDGSIIFDNQAYTLRASLSEIIANAQYFKEEQIHKGFFQSQKGEIQFSHSILPLKRLLLEFVFDSNSVQISRFLVDSELLSAEASGYMRNYQLRPSYLFQVKGHLQLDQMQPLFGLDNRYTGILTMAGEVQGESGQANFTGKIMGKEAILSDIPVKKFEASFEGDRTAVSVSNLNLDIAGGSFQGKLHMPLVPEREASVDIQWDSINLERLGKALPRLPLLLSSKTRGNLLARWSALDFKNVEAEGDIAFKSLGTFAQKEGVRLDGRLKFKASKGSLEIYPSDLSFDNSQFSFSGTLDETNTLKGNFRLKADDLSEIGNQISRLKSKIPQLQKLPAIHLAGQYSLLGNASGTLSDPEISLNLLGEGIAVNQTQIPLIKASLIYHQESIKIPQLLMEFSQGQVQGQGSVSYDRQEKALGKRAEFTLSASHLDIAPILASFPVDYPVQGLFSGELRLFGSFSDPEAEFRAVLSQILVEREDFSRLEMEGTYKHKSLQMKKFTIHKGDGVLEGSLGLNPSDRSYTVNLKGKDFKLADFKSIDSYSFSGRLNFNLEGKGTLERPEFALSLLVEEPRVFYKEWEFIKLEVDSDGTTLKSSLDIPEGQTSFKTSLTLQEPVIIQGHLSTTSLDALNLMQKGRQELPALLTSEITTSASFSVPLKNWKEAVAAITMEKAALTYRGLMIQNDAPIVLSLEKGELTIQDFRLSGPNTKFSVSGKLPLEAKRKGRIKAEGTIQLELLELFLPGFQFRGAIALQSEIMGSLTQPSLNAQVELKEGGLTSLDIPYILHDLVLLARIEENTVNLEKFSIGIDEGNFSARGKFSLSSLIPNIRQPSTYEKEGTENDIEVSFTGLNLGKLSQLSPNELSDEFSGLVEGNLHIRGIYTNLSLLEVEGELSRLLLSFSQVKLENDDKIKFSLKDSTFRLNELRLLGANSFLFAAGSINLEKEPQMDARFSAALDSAIITPFVKNAVLGGNVSLDLNLTGPVSDPIITGSGEFKDGLFEVRDYPVLATNIKGNIEFAESTVNLTSLQGIINGGTFNIRGKLYYRALRIESAKVEMNGERIQVNYPEGLQAQTSATLSLEGEGSQWRLRGDMKITQGYYGTNIYPGAELINNIRFRRAQIKSEIPPLIQNINLDIGVSTLDAFVIDNNLANLEMDANIRIMGTVLEPRIAGRVASRYVGEIFFAERSFEVEQASVDFLGQDPLEAQLNVIAHTNLTHEYDELEITLTLTGPIINPSLSLSSFPPRSQGELASLLITGYGTEKLRTETANIIGNQLILYFASPLASPVTQRIKSLLRAEEVSIEPINIATEEDPGARFTFRKGLIKNVDVVYSIDVGNTQQQTWILDYNLSRNFSIRSFSKDDGSYGSSLSHRFSLKMPTPRSQTSLQAQTKRFYIKEVKFEGEFVFPRQVLSKRTRHLKKRGAFNYGDLRKSIDNLTAFYKENNYLNAVITPQVDYENSKYASVTLNISPQKPAMIVYDGDALPRKIKEQVIDSWNGRLPQEMAITQAKNLILDDLKSKGFYAAEVEARKDTQEERSVYRFSVKQGPEYSIRKLTLSGKSSIDPDTIQKELSGIPQAKGRGLWILLYNFRQARTRIKDFYAEQGYLQAEIGSPLIKVDHNLRTIEVSLPVEEGQQSRIRRLEIKGNQTFKAEELKEGFRLREESIYRPSLLSMDNNHLLNFYRSKGYQDARVDLEIIAEEEGPDMSLIYTISEGELHIIGEIEISGNRRTPDSFIRRELLFKEGEPVNMEILILSQKKLYDLSIFKTVNIRRQNLEDERTQEIILIEVQEDPSFALSYGLRYSSEEKFEGFGQFDLINVLGRGRKGLVFYRQSQRQKDLRFSLKDPYLFGLRLNALHSFYYFTETKASFKTEEIGYTIQQEIQLPFDFSLSYLYRFNRIHTYELEPVGPFVFDITLFLSELQTFLVRDTRINKLDAWQGSFFSLSFTYSPEFLGSDLTYISFFFQYSLYKALGSGFTWASNYRVGLADAFDQVLIPSKRFFAGGGNSIRGFKRDMVGPMDPFFKTPEGGEALFIMNQELRFPIYKWLKGVAFYDVGNVYVNFSDFNPFDIRQSFGLGLRLNTPAVLIRLDYGINLNPQPDEPRGVFFFSIGQAF